MNSHNVSLHLPRTDRDGSSRFQSVGLNPVEQTHARPMKQSWPQGHREASALAALLMAYCVFLVLGTFAHTQDLDGHFAKLQFNPKDVFLMVICWTWTNLLILCCLSSAIGEFGRRKLLGSHEPGSVQGAMARGFFIFVVIMAGQLIVLGTPEATAVTPSLLKEMKSNANLLDDHVHICLEHFFRMAGVASLLSFISGIDPRFFRNLVNRWESIGDRAGRQPKVAPRKHALRPRPGAAAQIPVGAASGPRPHRPVQPLPPEPLETGQAVAN